jgi:hypothetical protein
MVIANIIIMQINWRLKFSLIFNNMGKNKKFEKEFDLEYFQYFDKAGRFNDGVKELYLELFGTTDIQNIVFDAKTSSYIFKASANPC